jgi:HK97 family phage major capsid protein
MATPMDGESREDFMIRCQDEGGSEDSCSVDWDNAQPSSDAPPSQSMRAMGEERNRLLAQNRQVLDRAEREGRALNTEEAAEYDKRDRRVDELSDQITQRSADDTRRQRLSSQREEAGRPLPRQTQSLKPGQISEAAEQRFNFGKAGSLSLADIQAIDPRVANQLRARSSDGYRQNFASYLRGDKRDFEKLGLLVGNDPKGGYLAPISFVTTFIKFLDDLVSVRGLATVLPPTTAKSVGAMSFDTDYGDADWTAEVPASDISEDDAARFGKRELTPHLLSKMVKVSRKMLRSSTLNIEQFLAQRLAYRFAITENKAYLTGDGAQKPLGLFTASNDGITTARDTTCAAATSFTADELIDVQHSVKDIYRQNGSWIGSREFRKRCRKLKDGNGQYLLTTNTASGLEQLFERPLVVDENAPSTFTAGLYIALFGDVSMYWIQDGLDMEIQRLDELFALRNQVGWIGRKETDAMPVLAEAFGRLKLA